MSTPVAIRSAPEVLLHAERTADPRVVRWVVRGHLAGPCVVPTTYVRDDASAPPLVADVFGRSPSVTAVTIRPDAEQVLDRADVPVLRLDVEVFEAGSWRRSAGDVQDAIRAAARHRRWWPDGATFELAAASGRADSSLPSGPCRSCPRSSSKASSCARPPDLPPAST